MLVRLEHANLNVHDLDGVVRFLRTAFPEFRVRHEATGPTGARWVHVGTADTYVTLNQRAPEPDEGAAPDDGSFNHLGYEVEDIAGLRERLLAGGFLESGTATLHPHRRRVYFHDPDGNEWEFVQYLTPDSALRHDYALPDRFDSLA